MKKTLFLFLSFACAYFVHAGNHTIVVDGDTPKLKGNTEIKPETDSIFVKPAIDVSSIMVKVTDTTGSILSVQAVPANVNVTINVQTPALPEGCILEIHDDKGLLYSEHED